MTTMRRPAPYADRIKKKPMYLCYVLVALSLLLPLSLSAETEAEVHAAYKASAEAEKPAVLDRLDAIVSNTSVVFLKDVLANGETSALRSRAAQLLGKLKQGRVELQNAFDNDDRYVRTATMQSLATIGDPMSYPWFVKGFGDTKNPDVRLAALKGLSLTGKPNDAAKFREALNWGIVDATVYAIEGFGTIGARNEWNNIRRYCEDSNPSLVAACLRSAGRLRNPESVSILEARILDQNQEIAAAAIEAIGNFGGQTTIQTLIRVKKANPSHPLLSRIHDVLKKNKAGKQYAVLSTSLNFRQQPNEQAASHGILGENEVVEVLERGKRKYTYLSSTGQEYEDFWYKVKDFKGRTGYVYGAFVTLVDTQN
ncbi:MAG: SH3 domain-containing protein [Leptonema illini]|uniref:SH3 domain-containing protein n=1 Tax=Leptonema illini TaxID=183 RepID=A0A833LY13_9LEPT|nr:MAG: SH3 domain-containing protein [Leptonema illini]PKL32188.1 MAG: SH3 domain-containing protein [Spirochaetae bacterium HGW-Spirochaetae-10]